MNPVALPKRNEYGGRNKYRAVKTVVDGVEFASKAEARRYSELKLLERAGEISGLELQPSFPVTINGVKCFVYRGDFRYWRHGKRIVEDCKGFDTPVSKLKRKCVEALYGPNFTIELVK